MAVFVDLDDDDVDPSNAIKPIWNGAVPPEPSSTHMAGKGHDHSPSSDTPHRDEAAHQPAVQEPPNSMTVALGCYP